MKNTQSSDNFQEHQKERGARRPKLQVSETEANRPLALTWPPPKSRQSECLSDWSLLREFSVRRIEVLSVSDT